MKASNRQERLRAHLRFALVFAAALALITLSGVVTIVTARRGIALLLEKQAGYDEVFKRQAELNFQLESALRKLNDLRSRRRNASEHRHMQLMITKERLWMERVADGQGLPGDCEVYGVMLDQLHAIQSDIDELDRETRKRESSREQLEKCRTKYQEVTKNRLTKP